eukprot:TRINITY_DN3307_c0_g1_i1.p1 TRINITY_DN3307_c0_g1~~TRINITY_DN3307_c0_g1_i1.p1  ORF type:complete len:204 (+),score=27.66 TRINITY_DN3307_c0_g1_i1:54-665(+)
MDLIQYLGIILLITYHYITEKVLREKSATSMKGGNNDKNTTNFTLITLISVIFLPIIYDLLFRSGLMPNLNNLFLANFNESLLFNYYIVSCLIIITGIIVRWFAMKELGEFFSRTLKTTKNQRVIKTGIYKFVRHPGYLATTLAHLGYILICSNIILNIILVPLWCGNYYMRITSEEEMLIKEFKQEYIEYKKNSKFIIPFIF